MVFSEFRISHWKAVLYGHLENFDFRSQSEVCNRWAHNFWNVKMPRWKGGNCYNNSQVSGSFLFWLPRNGWVKEDSLFLVWKIQRFLECNSGGTGLS